MHYSIFSYIYAFVLSLRSPGACSLQAVLGNSHKPHNYTAIYLNCDYELLTIALVFGVSADELLMVSCAEGDTLTNGNGKQKPNVIKI